MSTVSTGPFYGNPYAMSSEDELQDLRNETDVIKGDLERVMSISASKNLSQNLRNRRIGWDRMPDESKQMPKGLFVMRKNVRRLHIASIGQSSSFCRELFGESKKVPTTKPTQSEPAIVRKVNART